ncbi:uncharacterized protein LOC100171780 [Pongo abelii]|uniref:Uncharacterized protein DKFZp469C1217 n=1 Tax=Pongo abelii TaxID=9601 RepID=Q5RE64_PONAB|nr:uncharacterized protein LOC100171780 [Pongo abelii]CAH89943.1 hypothetical protein [Pongo abelii]
MTARENEGEAVAAREGGSLLRDRGMDVVATREEGQLHRDGEWRLWPLEKDEQRLWPLEKDEQRLWPLEKDEQRLWPLEKDEQRLWPPEKGAAAQRNGCCGCQRRRPVRQRWRSRGHAAQMDALPGVLSQLRPATSLPPHIQPPPHGAARIMPSLPATAPAPSCPVRAVTASAQFCVAQSRGLGA